MKGSKTMAGRWLWLVFALGITVLGTGCKNFDYSAAHRRIYAIQLDPVSFPVTNLDLDSPVFTAKKSFGTNERPTLVVSGFWGAPKLTLRNAITKQKLGTETIVATWDTITIQPLDLAETGEYEVYLRGRTGTNTAFTFSVIRNRPDTWTNNPPDQKAKATAPAWPFGTAHLLEIKPPTGSANNYNALYVSAVQKTWFDLLDQRGCAKQTGVVILKYHLYSDGRIDEPSLKKSTVKDDHLVLACKDALLQTAPFQPWPDGVRKKIGKDRRDITFTFYYY